MAVATSAYGLSMARTKGGRLLVAYGDNVAKKIRINRYADDDTTVVETVDLATVPDMPSYPSPPYAAQPIRGHHPRLAVAPDGLIYCSYSFTDFANYNPGYIAFSRDEGETWTSLSVQPIPGSSTPDAFCSTVTAGVDRQGAVYFGNALNGWVLQRVTLSDDETAWGVGTRVNTGINTTIPSDLIYPGKLLWGRDRSLELWGVFGTLTVRRAAGVGPDSESSWATVTSSPTFASQSISHFGVDHDPVTGMYVIAQALSSLTAVRVARVNAAGTGLILSSGAGGIKSWASDNLIAVDVLRERDGSWRICYWQGGVIRFKTCAAVAFDGSANWV